MPAVLYLISTLHRSLSLQGSYIKAIHSIIDFGFCSYHVSFELIKRSHQVRLYEQEAIKPEIMVLGFGSTSMYIYVGRLSRLI